MHSLTLTSLLQCYNRVYTHNLGSIQHQHNTQHLPTLQYLWSIRYFSANPNQDKYSRVAGKSTGSNTRSTGGAGEQPVDNDNDALGEAGLEQLKKVDATKRNPPQPQKYESNRPTEHPAARMFLHSIDIHFIILYQLTYCTNIIISYAITLFCCTCTETASRDASHSSAYVQD